MNAERCQGANFSLVHLGATEDLRQYRFQHPKLPVAVPGKVFLQELIGLTGMEISFGLMPAGKSMPFHHKHRRNEEVYLFLRGRGQFQIDGEIHEVREGTVIRVAPAGVRAWRNHSSEDLFYVVIQARAGTIEGGTTTDGEGVPGPVTWAEAEATA
jgi:mannose-6-phosphate isomerase-like protein (cupin superfamily)